SETVNPDGDDAIAGREAGHGDRTLVARHDGDVAQRDLPRLGIDDPDLGLAVLLEQGRRRQVDPRRYRLAQRDLHGIAEAKRVGWAVEAEIDVARAGRRIGRRIDGAHRGGLDGRSLIELN